MTSLEEHILLGGLAVLSWTGLYYFSRQQLPNHTPEFCNRIVTTVHAMISTVMGLKQCFRGGWIYVYPDHESTYEQEWVLRLSWGYFIFDLGWCLNYKTETALMVFHHIYSAFSLGRLTVRNKNAGLAACAVGGAECTNPILQLRWFLRFFGYQKTMYYDFCEYAFVISFVLMRIGVGTLLTGSLFCGPSHDTEFKLYALVLYGVSLGFIYTIYKFAIKKAIGKPASSVVAGTQTDVEEEGEPDLDVDND